MGLRHDNAKPFSIYISAAREVWDSAEGVRNKLLDAAGSRLLIDLPARQTRKQREFAIRNCDLTLLLAPSVEHITRDVVWEAGFAAGQHKPVVYWFAGNECDDELPCSEAIAVDTPRLTDYLHELLLDGELLGEFPNAEVGGVLLRRLTTEIQEQMPHARARQILADARALAKRARSLFVEGLPAWQTTREINAGCQELCEFIADLEADADDRGLLQPTTLEKAFASPRHRSLVRRMVVRGLEARAELLDALTARDVAAIERGLLTVSTLHSELTALIEERSEQLTPPGKPLVRAA